MPSLSAAASPWGFPFTSQRMPVLADNVVSTSQPLACAAGMQMYARGGNAMDAALACAIALTVVEPCQNGIGGDAFALVWDQGMLAGLNASGRSPAAWSASRFAHADAMPSLGWDSVTVPGAVSAWVALSRRYGKLPFADLFEPAVRLARDGFIVSPTVHRQWRAQVDLLRQQPGFAQAFLPHGRAPAIGERFSCPGQAGSLQEIAESQGESFYRGALAGKMVDHCRGAGGVMTAHDLADHEPQWVVPVSATYGGLTLHEIGPSGQGIAALMALRMLELRGVSDPSVAPDLRMHMQVEAMKLALADLSAYVADVAAMTPVTPASLLDDAYLARRAQLIDAERASSMRPGAPHHGGTVYLTAADRSGMMVSLIQSNFRGFGSGVVVPGTGIAMHNRGSGFVTTQGHPNQVAGRKRPLHTIIPGFVTRGGEAFATLGVMGGSMQAQGHLQLISRFADDGMNPQAAIDAPRWRVLDDHATIAVEWNMPSDLVDGLRRRGHVVRIAERMSDDFGCAQSAARLPTGGYCAASDGRKDGHAAGI